MTKQRLRGHLLILAGSLLMAAAVFLILRNGREEIAAGESAEHTARELGCSKVLVKRVRRHFGHLPLPDFQEDYHPKAVRRTRLPDNPLVMLGGGDAIIDRIDAATYRALQEKFGSRFGG